MTAIELGRGEQLKAFGRLLDIMDELREKCPWDRKQTMESLRHLTIEEVYELGDAILDNDLTEVQKELGDIMLHMVFYARLGQEQGLLTWPMCSTAYAKNSSSGTHTYTERWRCATKKR